MRSKQFKERQTWFWIVLVLSVISLVLLYDTAFELRSDNDLLDIDSQHFSLLCILWCAQILGIVIFHMWGVSIVRNEYMSGLPHNFKYEDYMKGWNIIYRGLIGVTVLVLLLPPAISFFIQYVAL